MSIGEAAQPSEQSEGQAESRLWPITGYFLKLGALGFGGPAALVGYMHRDLVERRRWLEEDTYRLALALAQIMPGPLAAQTAIAIGYFQAGILGATLVGLAFVIPSFLMVVALSIAYVTFEGLWWMQALFYGIGAAVIAIIAIAAYKLARSTNKHDPLLWAIFAGLVLLTVWARAELAEFFVVAGLITLFVRTRPARRQAILAGLGGVVALTIVIVAERWLATIGVGGQHVLLQILAFFTKAGAFVFGSGRAVSPPGGRGTVRLAERAAVRRCRRVAMITPGPVVITVVFIGYLVAGFAGAVMAAIGIFL